MGFIFLMLSLFWRQNARRDWMLQYSVCMHVLCEHGHLVVITKARMAKFKHVADYENWG